MALTATQILYATGGAAAAGIAGLTCDGTNVTATSGILRFTSPRITTSLDDSNGNELIKFTATGSAVNELTIANAATGSSPTISATGATGGDTNIGITLTLKGNGIFLVQKQTAGATGQSLIEARRADGGVAFSTSDLGLTFVGNILSHDSGMALNYGVSGQIHVNSTGRFGFSSTASALADPDTAINRNAAGVVEINNGTLAAYRDLKLRQLVTDATVTAGGTTGAQTINKGAGTVNFAAAATSLVVTNSLVTASSIIMAIVRTDDTTLKSVAVVAASGSFTLHADAAATAETSVGFVIVG